MVLDCLADASTYVGLSPRLQRALRYLIATDWSARAPGRHDVEGEEIFALLSDYETRPSDAVPWEAHRRYIDVQYVHAGIERIGHAHLSTLQVGEYDEVGDLVSATGQGSFVTLAAGTFAIFWPHDAHRPGVMVHTSAQVRKVVLKVAVDEAARRRGLAANGGQLSVPPI